jgi:hypothetical protein
MAAKLTGIMGSTVHSEYLLGLLKNAWARAFELRWRSLRSFALYSYSS